MKRHHGKPQGIISPIVSRPRKTTGKKEKKAVAGYKIEFRGSYIGFCKTKADATKTLDSARQMRKSDADASKPVRRFKHVYPFCRAGKWQWAARIGSSYKEFHCEMAASEYASELCEKPITALKLGKRSRLPTTSAQDRFGALCVLFNGWEPADMVSAVRLRTEYCRFNMECPGLYIFALLAKEHPLRECVCRAWNQVSNADRVLIVGASSPERSLQIRAAKVMHAVFTKAWHSWSTLTARTREDNFWTQHIHRNIQYFWTPLNLARQMGLVRSVHAARGEGRKHVVQPFNEGMVCKLVDLHKIGSVLNLLPVTRTCHEYVQAKRLATVFLSGLCIKAADNEYKWPWLLRTHLVATMRVNGVERLTGTDLFAKDFNVPLIRDLVSPDQVGWAETWITGRHGSVNQLFQTLCYDSPMELFSAFTCVLFDSVLTKVPIEWLKEHTDAIKRARATFSRERGWEPNPAALIMSIFNTSTKAPAASKYAVSFCGYHRGVGLNEMYGDGNFRFWPVIGA